MWTRTFISCAVLLTAVPASEAAKPVQREFVEGKVGALEDALYDEIDGMAEQIEAARVEERRNARARIAEDGRPLYLRYCAMCHGQEGDGKGKMARYLSSSPRDFTRGQYRYTMTPTGTLAREVDIYRSISLGLPGTSMPGWKSILSRRERRLLAQYLMTLSPRYEDEEIGQPVAMEDEPPNDAHSRERGRKLYQEAGCAKCHGDSGRGDGPSTATTRDENGELIKPYDLTLPYYKGGVGAAVVFRALSAGLSGTAMPSFADTMSAQDRWSLSHYVLSLGRTRSTLFRAPAGRATVP